ncbi:hypothetical protein ACFLS9_05715 [Bacteroidota bacterium]
MGGKAALFMVLGFSTIFLVFGHRFNNIVNNSVDVNSGYFLNTTAHNLAVSGANLALNEIFLDPDWKTGFSNITMNYGKINVTVYDSSSELKIVKSVGEIQGVRKEILVKMKPSSFAKFAWYISNMSTKVFVTGDEIWGMFHSQTHLNIGGSPVLHGKATSLQGLNPDEKHWEKLGYNPQFNGGYQSGVDIPLPVNYQFTEQRAVAVDGVTNGGGSSVFYDTDIWLEFNSDATITYRIGIGKDTSTYNPPVTLALTTFAPNGVVYVDKGDIYVSGTLNGKVTLVSGESSGHGHGNIYIANDIVYREEPMLPDGGGWEKNENCTDMMAILATNNVILMDNPNNVADKDVVIHASIFCAQGGLKIENENIPASGTVYIRGGVIAAKEEVLLKTNNLGELTAGYKKHVVFDERMLIEMPIQFPMTGTFEIVSWLE